jgi:hypothetical protein
LIEDIHEPVDSYRSVFREAHARNTAEFFEELLRQSGVDEQANAKTVAQLHELERQVKDVGSTFKWWKILRIAVFVVAGICLLSALSHWLWLIGVAAAGGLVFGKLNPLIKDVDARLRQLQGQRDSKLAEALAEMAPLNRLHAWDTVARLVQRTVPRLELDPYFTSGRLDELRQSFGWSDDFNQGCSIQFAHSGALNGNPFVLAQTLNHQMGTKVYQGSLTITWTEKQRDSKGDWQTVTRSETLHASVEKPFPEYGDRTLIIYANEAAPDLSFSRTPSSLSKVENGIIGKWRKNRAIKKIDNLSKDIKTTFTAMSNREFDALFGALDRTHEVQFRLLFTPLAQQEMVKLLKDKEVGYGDNFEFTKTGMINQVEPAHLAKTDITADPYKFHHHEVGAARKFFTDYHNDFFKSFYFGIAPLLTIPLYQQHRSHRDIYKDVYARMPCFWEHESIAHYFGEKQFQHPQCITRSLLKTEASREADGTHVVRVAALGHGGVDRIEYVRKLGGDGRYHDVPVKWVEYFEVRRDSGMVVRESEPLHDGQSGEVPAGNPATWQALFQNRGIDPGRAILRRSIISALLPG